MNDDRKCIGTILVLLHKELGRLERAYGKAAPLDVLKEKDAIRNSIKWAERKSTEVNVREGNYDFR